MASTAAASPGWKKYQPSGLTGLGGSPPKGDQGSLPEEVLPLAVAARVGKAAAEANRRRRLTTWRICSPTPAILFSLDVILCAGSSGINFAAAKAGMPG